MLTKILTAATTLPLLTFAFIPITEPSSIYLLSKDYTGRNFFRHFDFFDQKDPTNGLVQYVNRLEASQNHLAGIIRPENGRPHGPPAIFIGVDATTAATTNGRQSVRITSKETFNHALIVADILHMPAPVCGVWPAYWILGSGAEWPNAGEIDILENINLEETNHYTLHTSQGIATQNNTSNAQKGVLATANCDVNAQGQDKNVGCSVTETSDIPSYGTKFNANGGGTFATLIDSTGVSIWFFTPDKVPADILSESPVPPTANTTGNWGLPNARFNGPGNDFDSHFKNMQVIFNTALCGDWAGKVWNQTSECVKLAPTCEEFVINNPTAFEDSYWAIQSVKIYEPGNANWTTPYVQDEPRPRGRNGTQQGQAS